MVEFKVGQEVIIKRNLGKDNGKGGIEYYYGGDIRDIPLGTKGIIRRMFSSSLDISLELANGRGWGVHPDEISLTEEQDRLERKKEEEFGSLLEGVLLEDTHVAEDNSTKQKSFKPQFNVREEFVVWMRDQFPDFKKCAYSDGKYNSLYERKEEVYNAAKLACEHGINTTFSCIKFEFKDRLADLNRLIQLRGDDRGLFSYQIHYLVKFIASLSRSLDVSEREEYG